MPFSERFKICYLYSRVWIFLALFIRICRVYLDDPEKWIRARKGPAVAEISTMQWGCSSWPGLGMQALLRNRPLRLARQSDFGFCHLFPFFKPDSVLAVQTHPRGKNGYELPRYLRINASLLLSWAGCSHSKLAPQILVPSVLLLSCRSLSLEICLICAALVLEIFAVCYSRSSWHPIFSCHWVINIINSNEVTNTHCD